MSQFVGSLCVQQVLIWAVYTTLALPQFSTQSWVWGFYGLSALIGAGVWLWVRCLPSLMTRPDTSPMTALGWANRLTLFRLLSLPPLGYLLVLSKLEPGLQLPLAVWASLAFLTDFLDGCISRLRGEISRLGQALDSGSDYILLLTLVAVFATQGLLPWWLLSATLLRLGIHSVFMIVLMWKKGSLILETTPIGKVAVFFLMTDLAVRLLGYVLSTVPTLYRSVLDFFNLATTGVLLFSIPDKVIYFHRTWKRLEHSTQAVLPE